MPTEAHSDALEQHDRAWSDMHMIRRVLGVDTEEFRQARRDVIVAWGIVRQESGHPRIERRGRPKWPFCIPEERAS